MSHQCQIKSCLLQMRRGVKVGYLRELQLVGKHACLRAALPFILHLCRAANLIENMGKFLAYNILQLPSNPLESF